MAYVTVVQGTSDVDEYHDAFMRHMEHSLSHLNDTLYSWRSHGGKRFEEYLSKASKHSVDALSHLEKIVEARHGTSKHSSRGRRLNQIYDDTSKQEAQKRLEQSKVEAESKIKNAVSLIQNAAQIALKNSTADLLGSLTDRSALTDIASTGKKLSDQIEQYRKIADFFDRSKGLFAGFVGGERAAEDIVPAAETLPAPAPSEDLEKTGTKDSDPAFDDFLRNMTSVFSDFDQEDISQSTFEQSRRRLNSFDWTESRERLLQNAESSLKAVKTLRETGLRVTEETADKIRQKTEQARQKYIDMADRRTPSLRGRALTEDSVIESGKGDLPEYLVFPGEADVSAGRSGIEDDVYIASPGFVETTTFVFIPISNDTQAEELIDDVLATIISAIVESLTAPVYIPEEFFDGYMYTYDQAYAPATEPVSSFDNTYIEKNKKIVRRRLQSFLSNQGFDTETEVLPYEQYEVTLYTADPSWFRSAESQNIIQAGDDVEEVLFGSDRFYLPDDESFQISLAIQMKSPEELGGLPTEALEFLGLQEPEVIEQFFRSYSDSQGRSSAGYGPRVSMLGHTSGGFPLAAESQSSENLADLIVSKLQNSVYRPSSLVPSDSDMFDMRWFFIMFAIAGVLMLCIVAAITGLKRHALPGYVVVSSGENVPTATTFAPPQNGSETEAKPANRKVSNLPA